MFVFSFSVDGTPIRIFSNAEGSGVPYPKDQPMRLYSSLWNADNWATRGGLVKIDWAYAPFVASYQGFSPDACVWVNGKSSCTSTKTKWWDQQLDSAGAQKLKWVRKNYMIYDYCGDSKRFPQGLPPECKISFWCEWNPLQIGINCQYHRGLIVIILPMMGTYVIVSEIWCLYLLWKLGFKVQLLNQKTVAAGML